MKSVNHQFLEFSDQVKKRYIKTRLEPISGWRLDPRNAVNQNSRLDFLLATPLANIDVEPYDDGKNTKHVKARFTYEDEVLELYTDIEVRSFERMNRLLIENGLLVEFDEEAPSIQRANIITDVEIQRLANTKTVSTLKRRLSEVTNVDVLNTLLEKMEDVDTVTMAHLRAVRERINELKPR